ncbi:MAG: hypothetical protein GDA52_00110 [Rhodobacteraceae bacterium]|nr:hypothetical protein [Paracoccaceae bacterium]
MRWRRYKRKSYWRSPERLDGQDERDAGYKNRRYFVYVLDTTLGQYVGHTYSVQNRVAQHRRGQTRSTAGTAPELVWTSRPFGNRNDAASFEAALKSLRDQKSPKFHDITGLHPQPWVFKTTSGSPPADRGGSNHVLWIAIGVLAVILLLAAGGLR